MKTNFLEINQATFIASEKNKVNNVSLTIKEKGEIVCLLGPSGVGKTTILRTIAGLQDLKSGEIKLKGNIISSDKYNLEPEKRNIALCFQDNSLFPHFNVIDNINIGAKRKNGSKFNYSDKDLIKILHLEDIQEKYPHQISSGEAQRVSLARSLMSKPDLLLLDEPFSSLDPELRESTRLEVHKLLKSVKMSAILVTHDTEEALSFADRIAVMRQGQIEQVGTPEEIYHKPETAFVANFLGQSNIIQGIADGRRVQTQLGQLQIESPAFGQVSVSIRPEHLVMETPNGGCVGTVCKRDFKGSDLTYEIDFNDHRCLVQTNYDCPVQVGQSVEVKAVESAVVVQEQT